MQTAKREINPSSLPLTPVVSVVNNTVTALSTDVARFFEKLHKNVVRDIESLLSQLPDSAKLNFELCFENSELQNGKPLKRYRMTRDGFVLLAMGFTGAKALQIKLLWLDKFNEMEAKLAGTRSQSENSVKLPYKFRSFASLRADLMHARMFQGLTYLELDRRIGVSASTLRKFINGEHQTLGSEKISKICSWLNSMDFSETSYRFTGFPKLRKDLQRVKAERNVSVAQICRETGVCDSSLLAFLRGEQHALAPCVTGLLMLWLDGASPKSFLENRIAICTPQLPPAPEEETTILPEQKEEPQAQPAQEPVAPPPFPQSKALLAWMNLQHSFLYMNLPSPSALFRESVETLNAYFSGFDQEEEKKDAS